MGKGEGEGEEERRTGGGNSARVHSLILTLAHSHTRTLDTHTPPAHGRLKPTATPPNTSFTQSPPSSPPLPSPRLAPRPLLRYGFTWVVDLAGMTWRDISLVYRLTGTAKVEDGAKKTPVGGGEAEKREGG